MATAELAIALPSVVLVLALCLTAMTYGLDQVRCVDAARVAARAAARGETVAVVQDLALGRAPAGASITIHDTGRGPSVRVSAPARSRLLASIPVASAQAEARWEPGAQP